jgi:molybdate/tungstate transport system ATP-binding protein
MTLQLQSLRKRLGSFVLPELDLTVEEGEYFVLLGPSGVGKTVLLEIVAGVLNPDAGKIRWSGRDITTLPPERRGFAIVYQDYALFPHMTVMRNIVYGLRAQGLPRAETLKRARTTAEPLGIEPLLDRMPETLSGGEQQRVALARALVVAPRLLLLDEPLSAVDLRTRRRLRSELKRIQQQTGTTFVHVTHDVVEAIMLGHRVGVMLDGRLHQIGTPEELVRRPSDRAVVDFLGMRNVFAVTPGPEGYCKTNGVRIHVGERPEPYVHIWIRPEEVLLSQAPFESSARNQFRCVVDDWEFEDVLVNVRVTIDNLTINALVTYASFEALAIEPGTALYATFKASAVHCF